MWAGQRLAPAGAHHIVVAAHRITAAGQHDHGNQAAGISESVGCTDNQLNFVVRSLYTSIGEAVFGCRNDGGEVPA